ncbi:hypothetical protein AB0H77_01400 [Streptomyces sp. NPDC050844]|uniref:hypothetical protein n=1 Tax=Streptomyces sp. NPDC050844 TaxID=3155790 RepID=UPI0033F8F305
MRVMLRARLDTQIANEAVKNGTLPKIMQDISERIKPEAAYFGPSEGKRCCTFVFDMQESSEMPPIAETLFELGAEIEIHPIMNAEDLVKGLAAVRS